MRKMPWPSPVPPDSQTTWLKPSRGVGGEDDLDGAGCGGDGGGEDFGDGVGGGGDAEFLVGDAAFEIDDEGAAGLGGTGSRDGGDLGEAVEAIAVGLDEAGGDGAEA